MFKYIIPFASTHILSASGKESLVLLTSLIPDVHRGLFPKLKDLFQYFLVFMGTERASCNYESE